MNTTSNELTAAELDECLALIAAGRHPGVEHKSSSEMARDAVLARSNRALANAIIAEMEMDDVTEVDAVTDVDNWTSTSPLDCNRL